MKITNNDLELQKTHHTLSEQFDVICNIKDGSESYKAYIGYIRYMYGHLTCHPVCPARINEDSSTDATEWKYMIPKIIFEWYSESMAHHLPDDKKDWLFERCKDAIVKYANENFFKSKE